MNGVHDCGGMQCYRAIHYTPSEPAFHAPWEGRVLALNHASWYVHNVELPTFRSDIESLPAVDYLRMSYWEIWFASLVNRLIASGWVSSREVELGHSERPLTNSAVPASPHEAVAALLRARNAMRKETQAPRFGIGARVRARNINPTGHTRLPRYVRDKVGTIARHRGPYDFPDTDEYNLGANPNHVYSVRFTGRELWGDDASPKDFIYLDLWERYLGPA
jgi:nitrile hydratase beta subunit